MAVTVEAINRALAVAIFSDGSTAPITNWFDIHGDDCEPDENPLAATAGPDACGQWHAIDLTDYDAQTTH